MSESSVSPGLQPETSKASDVTRHQRQTTMETICLPILGSVKVLARSIADNRHPRRIANYHCPCAPASNVQAAEPGSMRPSLGNRVAVDISAIDQRRYDRDPLVDPNTKAITASPRPLPLGGNLVAKAISRMRWVPQPLNGRIGATRIARVPITLHAGSRYIHAHSGPDCRSPAGTGPPRHRRPGLCSVGS